MAVSTAATLLFSPAVCFDIGNYAPDVTNSCALKHREQWCRAVEDQRNANLWSGPLAKASFTPVLRRV